MLNFSDTNDINNLIKLEKTYLTSNLDIQKSFNKQVLLFMKKLMSDIDFSVSLNSDNNSFIYLNKSADILNKTNLNIDIINNLLNSLSVIETLPENLDDLLKQYNCQFKTDIDSIYKNTLQIEKFIHDVSINSLPDLENNKIIVESSASVPNSLPFPEKTLIISESQKKVVLPYEIKNVEEFLQKNKKYNSIEEVINEFYTKPIDYYKFSSASRFKEAYKLIKNKEKGSTIKALSLAFELFGNYSLHPAIITACKSLDELDIYLACLDENTLNDFKFFDIKYEIPLAVC